MKKICFFVSSMFTIGGEQRITTRVVNSLVDKGYDVTIIIKNREDKDYDLYNLSKKIKIIELGYSYHFNLNNLSFFDMLRFINRKTGIFKNNKKIIRSFFCSKAVLNDLKEIFVHNQYDVVIGVSGDKSYILSYLKKYISGKIIYWNHMNFDTHYIHKNSRYYNEEAFIKPLLNNFSYIVNLNIDDVNKFKKYYNVKSIVINNCKSFESETKSELNNNKFISCGRLVEQKGHDKLIEIFKLFHEKNKDYKLDIYGKGPLKEKLERKIRKYHLENYVRICNEERRMNEIYPKYDVYLNTSIYEGFGLTTIEALECGLPVIAFSLPANNKLVKDDVNGRIIDAFDVKKYADVLLSLVNDKEKMKRYQKNASLVIKDYSIKNIEKEWIKIIEK